MSVRTTSTGLVVVDVALTLGELETILRGLDTRRDADLMWHLQEALGELVGATPRDVAQGV